MTCPPSVIQLNSFCKFRILQSIKRITQAIKQRKTRNWCRLPKFGFNLHFPLIKSIEMKQEAVWKLSTQLHSLLSRIKWMYLNSIEINKYDKINKKMELFWLQIKMPCVEPEKHKPRMRTSKIRKWKLKKKAPQRFCGIQLSYLFSMHIYMENLPFLPHSSNPS